MKKWMMVTLSAVIGTMNFALYGGDITIENKTPFKVVKYQIEDENEKVTTYNLVIPAKSSKKISVPDKGIDDLTFFFDDGQKISPEFEQLKSVHRITLVFPDVFKVAAYIRRKSTSYPVGQVKVSKSREVKSFSIAPLGKNGEWKSCSLVNAKKGTYSMPTSGKYMIKFQTTVKSKPEQIFNNDGKGYDLSKISGFSIYYNGLEADTDEEADED